MSCPFNHTSFCVKPSVRPDPSVGTSIILYGETFTWTDQHLSAAELNKWRKVGDEIVDEFFNEWGQQLENDVDIYNCIHEYLPDFVRSIRKRPQWFDKNQIQQGQLVFLKHSLQALTATFHYILLAGYGFQQMTNVLVKTQYLSSSNLLSTYHRLVETVQMIVSICCGDVDNFDKTFSDVIKVRFLHGNVRHKITKNSNDVPINQEDLLATLLGFSFLTVRCMENRMNICLSTEEKESYLHLWRYVGWLIGIEERYLNYVSSYQAAQIIGRIHKGPRKECRTKF